MTKRVFLCISIIIAIFIAIIVPFIFKEKNESINQTINISATIVSAFTAILTFTIALLLFNKFGVESPLIEKSLSKVIELLEKIKETSFSISSERFYFRIQMSDPFKYGKHVESYYGEKLIFSENYFDDVGKLFQISNNPFIPPSISQKMDQLQFASMLYDINENNEKEYSKLQVVGAAKIENAKFGRFNGQDVTVFEFLKMLEEVSAEIKQWFETNSTIPVNLNL